MGPENGPVETVDVGGKYRPAAVDTRKDLILKHSIFVDKVLITAFFSVFLFGISLSIFHGNSTVKAVGSGTAGVALGALANRLKDTKLNPD
jgi:hypothetical protein